MDIWVNEQPFLTDFEYRKATAFTSVPAGTTLEIGVAPSPSSSTDDIIATFPVVLTPEGTYIAVATGIVGNMDTPFDLAIVSDAREEAEDTGVDFVINHGSTDAPAVDILARDVATLADSITYGDITDYINCSCRSLHTIDVTPEGVNEQIVASYAADLSSLEGGSAFVFASGFLAAEDDDPDFGVFAALADGTVIAFPAVVNEARLQVVHNSPSPTVDIWVNGTPFLTDFEYRDATPFVTVPAGTTLDIGIAPSPSSSTDDIIANFPVVLAPDGTYIAVATGIVGNMDTPFDLAIVSDAREEAEDTGVDFVINHGSTDAPAVDILARDVATLADSITYGDITDYINVPAGSYILDITPEGVNEQIVASFEADLSGLEGGSAFVFASGFLAPGDDDPAFGVFAALADGTVVEFPGVTNEARLQIIHNSPSPTVDIWVGDTPFLTDFEYRKATPYVTVPGGTTLQIGVAPSPSSSPDDIIATFPVNLKPDGTYAAIATGIVGNGDTPFDLLLVEDTREAATSGDVDFIINHGSTDAPAVDILARGVATLAQGAAYGDVTDYITVPAASYTLDITPAGMNDEIVASYTADLSGLGGGAAIVFASGFLTPGDEDPNFGIFAALADGTVVAFPAVVNEARLQIIHNSPSPTVDIWVGNTPFLTDFEYRSATPYVTVPAGTTLQIGVAPSPSSSPSDIIATFPANFSPDSTYIAIATGIVGNGDTPFDLLVVEGARETATSDDVDFIINHGSTDAPAVDVIARDVATLASNAAYGDITGYITVPPAPYIIDITPAGMNDQIVASFNGDLSSLGGGSAVIFASGFLTPGDEDPAFGLWVALADGTTFPLDVVSSTTEIAPEIKEISLAPNPANNFFYLELTLEEATTLDYSLINSMGAVIRQNRLGNFAEGEYREQIDISTLPAGYYTLLVRTEQGIAGQKFLKK